MQDAPEIEVAVVHVGGPLGETLRFPTTATIAEVRNAIAFEQKVAAVRLEIAHELYILDDLVPLLQLPQPLTLTVVVRSYVPEMGGLLRVAANRGNVTDAGRCIQQLADPDFAEGVEQTAALHIASEEGHLNVVRFLCDCRADTNRGDQSGATPMYVAAMHGNADVVQFLCSIGADKELINSDGSTPLHIAALMGYLDVVSCLCEMGAERNRPKADGRTAVYLASQQGSLEVVRYLCDVRADVNQQDRAGGTPLSAARERCHSEVAIVLEGVGAGGAANPESSGRLQLRFCCHPEATYGWGQDSYPKA